MDNNITAEALGLMRTDYKKIRTKIQAKRDKELERINKRIEESKEYKSKDEIQEAYGYGAITENKYKKLLEVWDENVKLLSEPTILSEYLRMLDSDIFNIEHEIIELRKEGEK